MADDNILAALSGFSRGLSSSIVPLMQAKFQSKLAIERAEKDKELRRVKIEDPALAEQFGLDISKSYSPEELSLYGSLAKTKANSGFDQSKFDEFAAKERFKFGLRDQLEEKKTGLKEQSEEKKQIAKIEREKPKAVSSAKETIREFDNMINEAKDIRNDPALAFATGLAAPLGSIPGTPSRRVAARLTTLKAKTLLNVLSSLKTLSATGASGFGQLSEIEGEQIRNSVSTLERTIGKKDFQASLDRFISEMEQRRGTILDTTEEVYGVNLKSQKDKKSLEEPFLDRKTSGSADDILKEFNLLK